ncbi:hypothetical protein AC1031_013064 [Aphanomyces cochlioides]|nr:hypothetical protein AC1031_013064 [Aphanomyces cochlioides]
MLRRGLAMIGLFATAAQSFTGDVTTYSSDFHGGNCGFQQLFGNFHSAAQIYFAALNAKQWNFNMECGRCAQVTCTSNECAGGSPITVMITDQCPECLHGALDLSNQGFEKLTGGRTTGRFKIEWAFVDCPSDFVQGPVEYDIKDGSNPNWIAFQPRNFARPVAKVEMKTIASPDWITLKDPTVKNIGFYFIAEPTRSKFDLSYVEIRTTSTTGDVILDTFKDVKTFGTLTGSSQFESNPPPPASSSPSPPTLSPSSSPPPATSSPTSPLPRESPMPPSTPSTSPPLSSSSPSSPSPAPSSASTTAPPSPNSSSSSSSPSPGTTTVAPSGTQRCSGASYELKQGLGGYALQIYITDAPQVWSISAKVSRTLSIFKPWNSFASLDADGQTIQFKPDPSHHSFKGPNHIGVLGNSTDVVYVSGVTYLASGQPACTIYPIHAVSAPESFAATESETSVSAGAVVGVTLATAALVGAVFLVWRVRRNAVGTPHHLRPNNYGGLITPIDFALSTPVAVL